MRKSDFISRSFFKNIIITTLYYPPQNTLMSTFLLSYFSTFFHFYLESMYFFPIFTAESVSREQIGRL